jgi:hypothetical protein
MGSQMRVPATNPDGITSVSFSAKPGSNGSISYNAVGASSPTSWTPAVQYTTLESQAAAKELQDSYTAGDYHRSSILNISDQTWTALNKKMQKVENAIAQERPDIAKKSWDFSMRDGKVVVDGGDLTANDKAWLENKINGTKGLAEAAADFISLASSYLETTQTNKAYFGTNILTGGQIEYNFRDTKKTLEQTISFRSLSSSLHQAFDTGHGHGDESVGVASGYRAFNYLAATALTARPAD